MRNKGLALGLGFACVFALGSDAWATARHIVLGLAKARTFEVRIDGELYLETPSGSAGVLEFSAPGAGLLHVRADGSLPDQIPPSPVVNLAVSGATGTSLTLSWTAPGDDGAVGRASTYDLRYSTSAITVANFNSALQASGEPTPQNSGQPESFSLNGLSPGTTYYLALRTADELSNWSLISNLPSGAPPQAVDVTAPASVTTLAVSLTTASSATLVWTAVGDDGLIGKATSYDIRYSLASITSANWGSATTVTGEPAPKTSGQSETFTVNGLSAQTTYFFAIKVSDEIPTWSGLSNVAAGATLPGVDTTAPANVTTLAAGTTTSTSIVLNWTSVGDDGLVGTAAAYEARYSISPLTSANWAAATTISGEPNPKPAGQPETVTVNGLTPNTTYYFGLKVRDEALNFSALSNVPSKKTLLPPDQTAPAAVTTLAKTSAASTGVTLTWTAVGDDGTTGRATRYDLRYALSPITTATWAAAIPANNEPAPKLPGQTESFVVGGLSPQTSYYFALKVEDEVPNPSVLSNVVQATTAVGGDNTNPSAVTNLSVAESDETRLRLMWTATGDDGQSGTAHHFDVRYSTATITASNFAQSPMVSGVPSPALGGTPQTMWVEGLNSGQRYYFAMKVVDEVGNTSPLSNVPSGETEAPPDVLPPTKVLDLTLEMGSGLPLLRWTAPHDSLLVDVRATSYQVHVSQSPIPVDGPGAPMVLPGPTPGYPGERELFQLGGLEWSTRYYSRIRSSDAAGNWSIFSNGVIFTTPPEPIAVDEIPPAAVTSLSVDEAGPNWISLEWIAPGDDGASGTATTYDLRYASFPLTSATWAAATPISGEPLPAAAGSVETMRVANLGVDLLYYFGVTATDEIGNTALISNVAQGRTVRPPDTAAPHAVADLHADLVTTSSLLLLWTTPADSLTPFSTGSTKVAGYDLRYRLDSLDATTWDGATTLATPFPSDPGLSAQLSLVNLLPDTTYAFALRSVDSRGNASALSNVSVARTLPLIIDPPPPPADTTGPAAPTGFEFVGLDPHHGRLTWNAPGDDGAVGQAAEYRLRVFTNPDSSVLVAGAFDWSDGDSVAASLTPAPAGVGETLELSDLPPGLFLVFGLLAVDESGNVGEIALTDPLALPWPADTLPPNAVTDLSAELMNSDPPPASEFGSLYVARLSFTAPSDPRPEREASSVSTYRILATQWTQDEIITVDWQGAEWESLVVAGAEPGFEEAIDLRGLPGGRHFAFGIFALDAVGNQSVFSNEAFIATPADSIEPTPEIDTTSPAQISNLEGYAVGPHTLRLLWTAVGDDSTSGRAARYEARWSRSPFDTTLGWGVIDSIAGLPAPDSAGRVQSFDWVGLDAGTTYYVALRVRDEAGNVGPFGAVVSLTTPLDQDLSPPAPPNAVALEWVEPFVVMNWGASSSADVVGYDVWRRGEIEPSLTPLVEGIAGVSWSDSTVTNGARYFYAVRARDAAGNRSTLTAEQSLLVPVLTPIDPNGPVLVVDLLVAEPIDPRSGSVTLRWSVRGRDDLEGFNVWREALPTDPLVVASHDDDTPHPDFTTLLTDELLPGVGPHRFDDNPLPPPGAYLYWVEAVGTSSGSQYLEPMLVVVPEMGLGLFGVFPNPCPGTLHIAYGASGTGEVRIGLYDATGRSLGESRQQANGEGRQEWSLDLAGVAREALGAGIYFLRIESGTRSDVARVVVVRAER